MSFFGYRLWYDGFPTLKKETILIYNTLIMCIYMYLTCASDSKYVICYYYFFFSSFFFFNYFFKFCLECILDGQEIQFMNIFDYYQL